MVRGGRSSTFCMKIPRKRYIFGGLFLAVIATYIFFYNWELQWNTESGKERQVGRIGEFEFSVSSQRSTPLSEWRGTDESNGGKWVKVASGSVDFALTSYYYPKIYSHLIQMGRVIEDTQHRREYAGWILEALEQGDRVGDVVRHCKVVEDEVFGLEMHFEVETLPLEQLEQIWREPGRAQQDGESDS
jgi:hypothetical protein